MEEEEKGVKLVGYWLSPFVQRVKWALRLKGIPYEYVEEDIFNKTHILYEINPFFVKVPVLLHGDRPLPESAVILEYMDDTWKHNPLFPPDLLERAQLRVWAKFIDEQIFLATWMAYCSEGEKQERRVKEISVAMDKLEEKLKGKKFFGGDTLGFLDLVVGFIAYVLPVWEDIGCMKIMDPVRFPSLAAWTKNFTDHEVIRADRLPTWDDFATYLKWRRGQLLGTYP